MAHDPWSARIDFAKALEEIAYMLGDPSPGNPVVRIAVSQEKLATALEMPRGTVRMYMEGSEPSHFNGERILERWCILTGKARTFAPVDRWVYSAHKVSAPAPRKREDGVASLVECWGRALA